MKAYDEQMVEEKKSKGWGASWVLQTKEIRCGWLTLYKQKTKWSPEKRKNGNKFTVFSRSNLSQKVSRPLCLKKKMKRHLWLIVSKCIMSFEGFKIFFPMETEVYVTCLACFWRVGWLFGRKNRKSGTRKDLALSFLYVSDESFECTRLVIFYLDY